MGSVFDRKEGGTEDKCAKFSRKIKSILAKSLRQTSVNWQKDSDRVISRNEHCVDPSVSIKRLF